MDIYSDEWNDFISSNKSVIDDIVKPTLQDYKKSNCLVLPSGGVKGVYLLGAIEYLYEKCGIDHIKSFYGCSIGSIISGLLIIGYKPMDLLVYICINKIMACLTSTFHISNIVTENKCLDSTLFITILRQCIIYKIGYIPTLKELYVNFKKKLYVVTISRQDPLKPIYVSHENYPDIPLDQALHMSSSIPIVLGYANYNNIDYIDGGLLDPFPILEASKKEKHVFGINIIRTISKSDNLLHEIVNILYIPILNIENNNKNMLINGTYIELNTNDEHITKKSKELLSMFSSGYNQCRSLLQVKPSSVKNKKE